MPRRFPSFAIVALLGLVGCNAPARQSIERTLTVNGDPAVIERFVTAQRQAHPTLRFAINGREARTQVPAAYTGKDIVAMTHAALTAGLNYSVSTHAVTQTPPSTTIEMDAQVDRNTATRTPR